MAVASLHPSSDGSRFEVHSKVHSSAPKMIVKSSHRGEIARWIQALKLNIEYHSKREQTSQKPLGSPEKRAQSFSSTAPPNLAKIHTTIAPELPADRFLSPSLRSATALTSTNMIRRGSSPAGSVIGTDAGDAMSIFDAADKVSMAGTGDEQQLSAGVPHEPQFDMAVLNIKAQLDMTAQLVDSVVDPASISQAGSAQSSQQAIKEALQQSLKTLSVLVSQQNIMSKDRERYYVGRIQREVEARKLWEENMLTVAQQQAETDAQLNEAARVNEKRRKALRQAKGVLAGLSAGTGVSLPGTPTFETPQKTAMNLDSVLKTPPSGTFSPGPETSLAQMHDIQQAREAVEAADSDSEDEDDEFFDAIESNNITNLSMHESIANPDKERAGTPRTDNMFEKQLTAPKPGSKKITDLLARQSLQPYLHVRSKLPIDDDKRPSVSCEYRISSARIKLTLSVEHLEVIGRQGLDQDFVPSQLQRVHFHASKNG
jgi:hypothetical protein